MTTAMKRERERERERERKEKERLVLTVATTRKQTPPNFDYVTVTSLFKISKAMDCYQPWRGSKRVAYFALSVSGYHHTMQNYAVYSDYLDC
jgi:hypothetical protein